MQESTFISYKLCILSYMSSVSGCGGGGIKLNTGVGHVDLDLGVFPN